jgi:uncharacterized membrane protein
MVANTIKKKTYSIRYTMNEYAKILIIAIGMAVLDAPWLMYQSSWVQEFVREIQGGRSINMRLWPGIPVYLALAYIVTQQVSAPRAFLIGMCTYAVYDFTQLFSFDKYPLEFAVLDTLWGGLLVSFSWWLANRLGLVAAER